MKCYCRRPTFSTKVYRPNGAIYKEGKTIILVSHDLHAVRSLCSKALWLDKGAIQMVGPSTEVVDGTSKVHRPNHPSYLSNRVSQSEMSTTVTYESSMEDANLEANMKQHFSQ